MKQYLSLCNRIIDEGEWVFNERTGKKTLVVINADLEYNVGAGEFPMVTTRKSFYKSAIAELLGYIRGYDNAADFRKLGTKTWDANANLNKSWNENPFKKYEDDMGVAYRFRTKSYFEPTITMTKEYPKEQKLKMINELIEPDTSKNKHKIVGKIFASNSCGKFKVIKEYFKEGTETCVFEIQFIETGNIILDVNKGEIKDGEVQDVFSQQVVNIGCIGNISDLDEDIIRILKPVWKDMLERCYGNNKEHKKYYENVFVSDEWLIFENFVKDFKSTTNWQLKLVFPDDYTIDKDWVNANYYAKETVRWSTKKEQSINSKLTKTFIAKNLKTNEKEYYKSPSNFYKKNNLSAEFTNIIQKYKEGEIFIYKDWEIELIDDKEIRYIEVDQLKEVYAKLKLGIDDRRLIMDAWYPHTQETSCLMPCMHTHTFSLIGDTLHLTSYQRSCDVPLGLNFNMIQVYTLLALMAQITGKKAGIAYHKIVNAHFYEDQVDLMRDVQLKREPFKAPTLKINPEIKTLKDLETWVTMEDFTVENYEHHEAIKYPFSV